MYSLNRTEILGNLTRDPELKTIPSGQSVANFAVATNRRWKDPEGNMKEDVQYHEMVIWGKQAELAVQMLKKGKKVYIEGRLQTRSWEGTDGAKRSKTEIVVENFIPLSPKTEGSDFSIGSGSTDAETPTETKKPAKKVEEAEEINLDDIPF